MRGKAQSRKTIRKGRIRKQGQRRDVKQKKKKLEKKNVKIHTKVQREKYQLPKWQGGMTTRHDVEKG